MNVTSESLPNEQLALILAVEATSEGATPDRITRRADQFLRWLNNNR